MGATSLAGLRKKSKFGFCPSLSHPGPVWAPDGALATGLASDLGSGSVDPPNGHTTGSPGGLGLTGWLAGSYVRLIDQRTKEFGLGSDRATGLIGAQNSSEYVR